MQYRHWVRSKTPYKTAQTVSRCSQPLIRAPAHHFHAPWWPEGSWLFKTKIACLYGKCGRSRPKSPLNRELLNLSVVVSLKTVEE
jgi:hypothetical protein